MMRNIEVYGAPAPPLHSRAEKALQAVTSTVTKISAFFKRLVAVLFRICLFEFHLVAKLLKEFGLYNNVLCKFGSTVVQF